jgi:hypothetical protein
MHSRVLIATALAALAAAVGSQAGTTAATAKTKICGQVKHGPRTTYTTHILRKKLSGTTWTVFATGVPCSVSLKQAHPILKWFAKAKVGASDYNLNGFLCTKEDDGHGRSGSVGCVRPASHANLSVIMTGKYTIAQLKKMFHIH